jgi:hypothetical protein
VKLDARRSGEALRAAAGDLARVWRASRLGASGGVFPGVLDGVMEEFLERVAEALLLNEPPEQVWPATRGVVRLLPREQALQAMQTEWELASEVLLSACDALEVESASAERVLQAVETAAQGAEALLRGEGPAGVLSIHQLAGFRPRTVAPGGARR